MSLKRLFSPPDFNNYSCVNRVDFNSIAIFPILTQQLIKHFLLHSVAITSPRINCLDIILPVGRLTCIRLSEINSLRSTHLYPSKRRRQSRLCLCFESNSVPSLMGQVGRATVYPVNRPRWANSGHPEARFGIKISNGKGKMPRARTFCRLKLLKTDPGTSATVLVRGERRLTRSTTPCNRYIPSFSLGEGVCLRPGRTDPWQLVSPRGGGAPWQFFQYLTNIPEITSADLRPFVYLRGRLLKRGPLLQSRFPWTTGHFYDVLYVCVYSTWRFNCFTGSFLILESSDRQI